MQVFTVVWSRPHVPEIRMYLSRELRESFDNFRRSVADKQNWEQVIEIDKMWFHACADPPDADEKKDSIFSVMKMAYICRREGFQAALQKIQ